MSNTFEHGELQKYYQSLKQDIYLIQQSEEDGGNQEQIFTRLSLDLLSETGETENARDTYDEGQLRTKNQHKVNGYAVSDNYETLDLFITIYNGTQEISTISKGEIETAQKRISNFFHKCINKDYVNSIEESSEIFQLAESLANFTEMRKNLVRVNAFILTDGEYKGEFPNNEKISNYNIFFRVVDIQFLYKISEESRMPIEINFNDFDGEKFLIPCLSANIESSKYKTYISIIPGNCIAKLYERYGAKLLEQNVRSFLQFTGKINKGIRDTIRNEPEMFLAFNNGIAATADYIELDESEHYISRVSNLQIVNGGQTTASISNTAKKEKIDISKIYVQVKFSVIENPDHYSDIVSRISKYANTQNKVNDADFSANNPVLVILEKLSRYILSPLTATSNLQTCWFFERARGQYKTLRNREGRNKTLQTAFDKKFPQKQMFTKVELAKYLNSYQEVFDGNKLVIGPHIVVRGNEKNYAQFIANNLPEKVKKIDNIFFEDTIAKIILFKNADKRYGVKPNSIGEMKQVVVPYTLSLLNILTENKIDIYKIWRSQEISTELSDFIYDLMKQVNEFIVNVYNGQHYIENAKKEECWELVKNNSWNVDLKRINADLIDENNPPKRNIISDVSDQELTHNKELVKSIPHALWGEIGKWGKLAGFFDITKQTIVSNIAHKLKQHKKLSDEEYQKGVEILDIVAKHNSEILLKSEELTGISGPIEKIKPNEEEINEILFGLIRKMLGFNREFEALKTEESDFLSDILNKKTEFDFDAKIIVNKYHEKLAKKGFKY